MHFVCSSVVFPHLSKADDPTGQHRLLPILLLLDQHYPIFSFGELPGHGSPCELSRLCDIEDKYSPRRQRAVYAVEELNQRLAIVGWIEQIVEDFTYRRDGLTRWNVDLEQRSGTRHLELFFAQCRSST